MKKLACLLALFLLPAFRAAAYEPAVASAGPLTVRIDEPSIGSYGAGGLMQLRSPAVDLPIEVVLSNGAAVAVRGTLRAKVIDGWTVAPDGPVAFEVAPKSSKELLLSVRAAKGTYNAWYPVHVFVDVEHEGRRFSAHPILMLETHYPNPPRSQPKVEFKPIPVPARGSIRLSQIPIYRLSARIVSAASLAEAAGPEPYEASSPVEVSSGGRGGISVRIGPRAPSEREIVESGSVEFPVALPSDAKSLRLTFSTVATGALVSFQVRVALVEPQPGQAPQVILDQERIGPEELKDLDLSRFAGQAVRITFEAKASSPAQAYFLDPAVNAGQLPAVAPFPPDPKTGSRQLGSAGPYTVRLWPGKRGLLDAPIGFVSSKRKLLFQGFRVRVAGAPLEDSRSSAILLGVSDESAAVKGRYRLRHRFESWAGKFDLLGEVWVESSALRARFWLENAPEPRPWMPVYLEEVAAGAWNDALRRVYLGPGNVIEQPQRFQLGFDGHSMATSYAGFEFDGGMAVVQAVDVAPDRIDVQPTFRLASLVTPHPQTMTFIPAENVWAAAKAWHDLNGLKPSAGVPNLAGRFVFDIWGFGASYAESAKALTRAFRYGLTDAAVVWHNWQRWGYDYRLPDIFPPNPEGGSTEDFAALVRTCRDAKVLFAPHDNYIDLYPDAEGFSYKNVVFNRDGSPYKAWFHRARTAQSYRARPDMIRPFVERNVGLIKKAFNPSAYFIDVWSSMAPYDFWTDDGKFVDRSVTRRAWGETFAWIRNTLGDNAPQISEAGHDQLIGWLDGAQANHLRVDPAASGFTWRIRAADSERVPWFDIVHHDRFVLHGAGYTERYAGGLDLETHGIYSDDYITTEVLTGRPAMVADPFGRDVVRKYWLLHDLMRGLAPRRIDTVQFAENNIHRQTVRWDNGGEIAVNRGAAAWTSAGHVLPQYGYYARVPIEGGAVESAIEQRDGKTVEWTRSPALVYVNGRGTAAAAGGVTTAGAARVTRENDAIVVTPLPESGRITVTLDQAALPWKVAQLSGAEALDEQGRVLRSATLKKDANKASLDCEPDVFAYRLK